MSIQSKARRDARRRKEQREHNRARAGAPAIEPHAELRDADGKLLAGVVRQAGVWVLGMDGRIAGSSDSAAQMLMLIRRAQRLHDEQGITVKLVHSDALREEAELPSEEAPAEVPAEVPAKLVAEAASMAPPASRRPAPPIRRCRPSRGR